MIYKEERPWGRFEILSETEDFKVKKITVLPGKRLSLQSHTKRSEHWTILAGNGVVTQDTKETKVAKNDHVFIPAGQKHRILNTGTENLTFLEIQIGTYFGEDDIVRYEDDFDRL
jgi:mannose-6-phosphate isomerase-like protein (cupin superfamily)